MKIQSYIEPKSSFLSIEKDLEIITSVMMKNDNLKKLLYYNTKDCLSKPNLTESETVELFGKNIKIIPKLYIDNSLQNYIVIKFNNFLQNVSNPEFRNNLVEFDIVCHYEYWQLEDFQLRPYRIAAELDSIFDKAHLTGIGKLEFLGANQLILDNEYSGICLQYVAVHGEEDKKYTPNPINQEDMEYNFNKIFGQEQ